MFNKKIAIALLFSLLLSGQTLANQLQKVKIDPFGNPYRFWLVPNHTGSSEVKIDKGETFSQPQTLYTFTREVTAFDLEVANSKFYLSYISGGSLYLTFSIDNGQTFSPPLLLSEGSRNPSLAVNGNLIIIAWEKEGDIQYVKSEDGGINFSKATIVANPQSLPISDEVFSSPTLAVDTFKNVHLVFLSENKNTDLNRVIYTQLANPEPKVLFESPDNLENLGIKNLPWGILVFWQKEYMERRETYLSISLDHGQTFGHEKYLEYEKELLDLYFKNGKLSAITYGDDNNLAIQEIELPVLPTPHILFPHDNTVLNTSNLKLVYTFPGSDSYLLKIDLLQDNNTWSFEQLVSPPSGEVTYNFPVELSDGTYFLRMHIFDGLSLSPFSQTLQFEIDNIPPQILSLEAERAEKQLMFKGKISEFPAWLTINERAVTLESSETPDFETSFTLAPGENHFTFILTDEAGNMWVATEEAFYDPASPEITVFSPKETDWFKPDSTIFIEALVSDLQDDIQDQTEAEIIINHQLLEDTLIFDQQESKLFGFISVPSSLADGKYQGTIILSDKLGNKGKGDFIINIDGSPPEVNQEPCFTNSQTSFTIPLVDQGAGVDLSSTLIKISDVSFEGRVSQKGEKVVLSSDLPLLEGTYEVKVVPRDLIGNIGELSSFILVVDTTPPKLTLVGTYESQTNKGEIAVQGKVEEEHPSSVNIYNNQKKVESFALSGNYFSKVIGLIPGNNEILIEVLDKSGNRTSANISTFANIPTVARLITNLAHGPNPFSPAKKLPGAYSSHGNGMVFTYNLSQPADIKILIYDLSGTLIWTKEIKNATSGVTAWNGVDQFGQIAGNGIYPYIFQATSDGIKEIKRGKIIIYQ